MGIITVFCVFVSTKAKISFGGTFSAVVRPMNFFLLFFRGGKKTPGIAFAIPGGLLLVIAINP